MAKAKQQKLGTLYLTHRGMDKAVLPPDTKRIGIGSESADWPLAFVSLGLQNAAFRLYMKLRDMLADSDQIDQRRKIAEQYTPNPIRLQQIIDTLKSGESLIIAGYGISEVQDVRGLLALKLWRLDDTVMHNAVFMRRDGNHIPVMARLPEIAAWWGQPILSTGPDDLTS